METNALKVLVVDDEPDIVDVVSKFLEIQKEPYATCRALNYRQAIETYKRENPDICLLDVHLRDLEGDGIDVLKVIKEINPKAACIMVTRITDSESTQKARELGALHYLLKPFDSKNLMATVNNVARGIREGKY